MGRKIYYNNKSIITSEFDLDQRVDQEYLHAEIQKYKGACNSTLAAKGKVCSKEDVCQCCSRGVKCVQNRVYTHIA